VATHCRRKLARSVGLLVSLRYPGICVLRTRLDNRQVIAQCAMRITRYRFGEIEIDGRSYRADVIVTPERVIDTWWRREGHELAVADLGVILAAAPEVLVVGTGYYGRMAVAAETRRHLQAHGIALREARTSEAVKQFNRLQHESARVVAALHLTC
jgi:hypothetical protein